MTKISMGKTAGAWRQPVSGATAFERAQKVFGSELAAAQYPAGYRRDLKGCFERRAVLRILSAFPSGGHILDCPSGTGRVMQLLLGAGFRVTAADCSVHMVDRCRENMISDFPHLTDRMDFRVEDIASTTFPDCCFDGIICNRLFHHYDDASIRIRVLRELGRLTRGLIVVSFSNSFSTSMLRTKLRGALSGRHRARVNSISQAQMSREFEEAGMDVVLVQPVLWGLSRMWYMAGRPRS